MYKSAYIIKDIQLIRDNVSNSQKSWNIIID